jgi:hypothetical protein
LNGARIRAHRRDDRWWLLSGIPPLGKRVFKSHRRMTRDKASLIVNPRRLAIVHVTL